MPSISILLTSYNHDRFLLHSINSILDQTFTDFELFILDDGSTDNSQNIIRGVKDPRVTSILRDKNLGYAITSEIVNQFSGKYFAIAHCDDCWEKDKLEKQYEYLEKHDNVAACFTWVKYINEFDEELTDREARNYPDFNVENKDRFQWLRHFAEKGNCLCHPSVLLRTDVQKKMNLFTYGLGSLPDFYRWVKLCTKHEIYVYPEALTCFRVRMNGMNTSGRNLKNIIRNTFDFLQIPQLYEALSSEEFIKVFPDAERYDYPDLVYRKEILLAFEFVGIPLISSFYLYGLQKLYNLFQAEESRKELEEAVGFTRKDYVALTGKNDVMNIGRLFINTGMSLFFRNDSEYTADGAIYKNILLDETGKFTVFFGDIHRSAEEIRFDPIENRMIRLHDLQVVINGCEHEISGTNGIAEDPLCFTTEDPQIYLKYDGEIDSIIISGSIELLKNEDLFSIMQGRIEQLNNTVNQLNDEINALRNDLDNTVDHKIKRVLHIKRGS